MKIAAHLPRFTRKVLKFTLLSCLSLIGFIALTAAVAWLSSKITVNDDFTECQENAVTVYVMSNGVHTDLVVPMKNEVMDWTTFVDPSRCKMDASDAAYVAFGWGDKGFYLETPTWADLKFSTAFKAMFFLSTSAMHVTFHDEPQVSADCKKICISKENYLRMVSYIKEGFKTTEAKAILIENASYGDHDIFYDGVGSYSMFHTCNTWTNNGLKSGGLRACLWTLFDDAILEKYR